MLVNYIKRNHNRPTLIIDQQAVLVGGCFPAWKSKKKQKTCITIYIQHTLILFGEYKTCVTVKECQR